MKHWYLEDTFNLTLKTAFVFTLISWSNSQYLSTSRGSSTGKAPLSSNELGMCNEVSWEEVVVVLKCLRRGKAPSPDGIINATVLPLENCSHNLLENSFTQKVAVRNDRLTTAQPEDDTCHREEEARQEEKHHEEERHREDMTTRDVYRGGGGGPLDISYFIKKLS